MSILKYRLDKLLVLNGISENISKAQALIMSGKVFVDGIKAEKSGHKFSIEKKIYVKEKSHEWVSRGGIKLSAAIKEFNIDPANMICADVGSSTGGFTDVLLSFNPKKVYTIDVGFGQLAWKIRNNELVEVLEKINVRYVDNKMITELLDLIVCDLSFISITKALDKILLLTKDNSILLALIKPQFELDKSKIGKKGIVRNASYRKEAIKKVSDWLTIDKNWCITNIMQSPITGVKGNVEYFIFAERK